ncbi:MAG: voltage-gated potassium channel [Planctomycetota bacterium]
MIRVRTLYRYFEAAFHEPDSTAYRVVGGFIWTLILASLLSLAVEYVLPAESEYDFYFRIADAAFLTLFAIELVLRVATYEPSDLRIFKRPPLGRLRVNVVGRLRYLLQPLMLIDLITVLALLPELRALRILRLLRLLRIGRILRYGNPFSGLFHAFDRDRLVFALAFTFVLVQVVFGGITLYLAETKVNPSIATLGDAAWYALVTITTVGYGDITPVTGLGRSISGLLMIGGMFSLAMFAGIVSHSLLHAVLSVREEQFRMGNHANHIVVCGYESGMGLLLDTLVSEYGSEKSKIVVFADVERPPEVPSELYWIRGDSTKESELDKVRIGRAAAVLVAGARHTSPQQADAVTLLTLFTIRSYLRKQHSASRRREPVYVVAEILDSENVEHARAAGADEVIETRRLGFALLAHAIEHHGTADTLSEVVLGGQNTLFAGSLPKEMRSATYGELMTELDLSSRGGIAIGVTNPKTGEDHVNPAGDMVLNENMKLLYLATERILE